VVTVSATATKPKTKKIATKIKRADKNKGAEYAKEILDKHKPKTFVCCECKNDIAEAPLIGKNGHKWCWNCLSCGQSPLARYEIKESV